MRILKLAKKINRPLSPGSPPSTQSPTPSLSFRVQHGRHVRQFDSGVIIWKIPSSKEHSVGIRCCSIAAQSTEYDQS